MSCNDISNQVSINILHGIMSLSYNIVSCDIFVISYSFVNIDIFLRFLKNYFDDYYFYKMSKNNNKRPNKNKAKLRWSTTLKTVSSYQESWMFLLQVHFIFIRSYIIHDALSTWVLRYLNISCVYVFEEVAKMLGLGIVVKYLKNIDWLQAYFWSHPIEIYPVFEM